MFVLFVNVVSILFALFVEFEAVAPPPMSDVAKGAAI